MERLVNFKKSSTFATANANYGFCKHISGCVELKIFKDISLKICEIQKIVIPLHHF